MNERIIGTGVFEGYEYRFRAMGGCLFCEIKCPSAIKCFIAVGAKTGNWKRIKPSAAPPTAQPTGEPTVPGWYWVRGLSTPTRPVYINEHHIKMKMFMGFHAFADCEFAPCQMPEGWENNEEEKQNDR